MPSRIDGVGRSGPGRTPLRRATGQNDQVAVGGADHHAPLEPEPGGEPVENDPRLEHRIGDVVEPRSDVDERLQVGAALAQLALVHRREDGGRQGEEPERGDVEDRHPVEVDPACRG